MNRLFAANQVDDAIVATYHKAVARYRGRPEVTAIDIGYICRSGVASEDLGVRIHVMEKFEPVHLDAREMFPDEIDHVEIDVLVSRFANHQTGHHVKDPQRWRERNPIQPGISVGDGGETGTIGLFALDESDYSCLLSCKHVIASQQPDNGNPVFQPAKSDGGGKEVARLRYWHSFTDSAAARLVSDVQFNNKPFGCKNNKVIKGVREPCLGEVLQKSGRTTAITRGVVEGISDEYDGVGPAFYLVPESPSNKKNIELSWHGDSGAVWYCPDTMEAVGLHVKGERYPSPAEEYAVATCLTEVLEELRLTAP